MKIAIVGAGYVGLSLGVLLAQHHEVTILDIIPEKIDLINHKKSPFKDPEVEDYLAHKEHSNLMYKHKCEKYYETCTAAEL